MLDSAQLAGGALATGVTAARGGAGRRGRRPNRAHAQPPPDLRGRRFGNGDYWAFADWLAPYFDQLWDADRRYYRSGTSATAASTTTARS